MKREEAPWYLLVDSSTTAGGRQLFFVTVAHGLITWLSTQEETVVRAFFVSLSRPFFSQMQLPQMQVKTFSREIKH